MTAPGARRRLPKLLGDFAALSGGDLVSKVLGFVAFAWLARTLSPSDYGRVELVAAVTLFIAKAVDGGFGAIGVRELLRRPDEAPQLAVDVPAARLLIALVAVPLMGFGMRWISSPAPPAALTWLFAASLLPFALTQKWIAQGRERMVQIAFGQTLRTVVFTLLVLVLVRGGASPARVGIAEIAASLVCAAYFARLQQSILTLPTLHLVPARILRILREGASVGLAQLLWAFYQFAPLLLVAHVVGGDDSAWIGASMRVAASLLMVSLIYHFNLYPALTALLHLDERRFREVQGASIRLVAWVGCLAALVLSLAAEPLMRGLFGAPFAAAAPSFALLAWALPVNALSGHTRWALVACGRQRMLLLAQIAGAVCLLGVGAALTPGAPTLGAAAALLAASLTVWFATHFMVRASLRSFPGLGNVAMPALVSALAAAAARLLSSSPGSAAGIAATAFLLLALPFARRLAADFLVVAHAKERSRDGST